MYQLEDKIERLLKSALFKATKSSPCNIYPCLTRLYSDGTGRLVATNGKVLVAVRNGCDWPLGLYREGKNEETAVQTDLHNSETLRFERCWVRDEAMEAEMMAKLQGRIYPDWETLTVPTGTHDLYPVQRWGCVNQAWAVQAACVQSGVNVDWCVWSKVLQALMDVEYDSMSIKCFGPEQPVVVNTTYTGLDVLAMFMPFSASLDKIRVE